MMRHFKGTSRGFTLIEAIAVLLILGIVSAVAMSSNTSSSEANLSSQVEIVKSHFRYVQARAMNTNKIWGITFPSGSTYNAFYSDGTNKTSFLLPGQDNITVTMPSGMTYTASGTDISFDGWGRPFTNATGTGTSSSFTVTVTYGGQTKSFTVTMNTGFIS